MMVMRYMRGHNNNPALAFVVLGAKMPKGFKIIKKTKK